MIIPKKSLGQNFLLDKNICRKIVNNIEIDNNIVIEIGPGTGQITKEILLKNPKKLILIEKDNNLFQQLSNKYSENKKIDLINEDALYYDFSEYKKIKIISNLPYNISKKLILNLITNYKNINEMLFMVQKEFAQKINFSKYSKNNKLRFLINTVSDFKILFSISNKVFYPRPKVNSCMIKIIPKKINIDIKKLKKFSEAVFINKRKIISNVLKIKIHNDDKIYKLINKRAEDLSNKDLLNLFQKF